MCCASKRGQSSRLYTTHAISQVFIAWNIHIWQHLDFLVNVSTKWMTLVANLCSGGWFLSEKLYRRIESGKRREGKNPTGKKSPKSPYPTVRLSQGSKEAGLPIHVLPTPVVTQAFRPFSSYLNGGKVIKAMRWTSVLRALFSLPTFPSLSKRNVPAAQQQRSLSLRVKTQQDKFDCNWGYEFCYFHWFYMSRQQ